VYDMGWRHQMAHGADYIRSRLSRFNDTLPDEITITMKKGMRTVTETYTYVEGETFLEALKRELDSIRASLDKDTDN